MWNVLNKDSSSGGSFAFANSFDVIVFSPVALSTSAKSLVPYPQ
jgi:hypothetical protein